MARRLKRLVFEDVALVIYRHDLTVLPPPGPELFHRNHVQDLLGHVQTERWYSTRRFHRDAWQRLADGELVYTASEGGVLLGWFWVVPNQDEAYFSSVRQRYRFGPGSFVVYGGYVHPSARGRGLYVSGKRTLLHHLATWPGARCTYSAVEADNLASRRVQEKLGYHVETVLRYRRWLWWSRQWRETVAPPLK